MQTMSPPHSLTGGTEREPSIVIAVRCNTDNVITTFTDWGSREGTKRWNCCKV
ncbi:hypothetical protein DPMN_064707 [Dreissena polymorpha]|uniref:Uncharacterized protein n=1 Tax=Dreissena polymorpha TaxID=45954 RepID=A0A9D4HL99_DREPO|nr:hypothetical protein DPMN_064707 [Dreissena polymorpha]